MPTIVLTHTLWSRFLLGVSGEMGQPQRLLRVQHVQEDGREREERGQTGSGEVPLLLPESKIPMYVAEPTRKSRLFKKSKTGQKAPVNSYSSVLASAK